RRDPIDNDSPPTMTAVTAIEHGTECGVDHQVEVVGLVEQEGYDRPLVGFPHYRGASGIVGAPGIGDQWFEDVKNRAFALALDVAAQVQTRRMFEVVADMGVQGPQSRRIVVKRVRKMDMSREHCSDDPEQF